MHTKFTINIQKPGVNTHMITIGWNNDMQQIIARQNTYRSHKKQCIAITNRRNSTQINQQRRQSISNIIFSNDDSDFADSKILQKIRETNKED